MLSWLPRRLSEVDKPINFLFLQSYLEPLSDILQTTTSSHNAREPFSLPTTETNRIIMTTKPGEPDTNIGGTSGLGAGAAAFEEQQKQEQQAIAADPTPAAATEKKDEPVEKTLEDLTLGDKKEEPAGQEEKKLDCGARGIMSVLSAQTRPYLLPGTPFRYLVHIPLFLNFYWDYCTRSPSI